MLLEPGEKPLDLPACVVEAADLDGRALEVCGEECDLGSVVAPQANAAHRDGELGITFTDQLDLGIVEDGEAVAFVLNNGPPALGAKARALLHAGHEAGAGSIDAGPPVVAAIALVEDVGAAGGDRHRPAALDVVDVGIVDVAEGRLVGHRYVDDMLPAAERLVVGLAGVTIHKRVKPTARDRLEKAAKSAIAVTHARSFLSLDNQKVAGSSCCDRACTRVIVNRSPDSPAFDGGGQKRHRRTLAVEKNNR